MCECVEVDFFMVFLKNRTCFHLDGKLKDGGIFIFSGCGTFEHHQLIGRERREEEELLLVVVKVDAGLFPPVKCQILTFKGH